MVTFSNIEAMRELEALEVITKQFEQFYWIDLFLILLGMCFKNRVYMRLEVIL